MTNVIKFQAPFERIKFYYSTPDAILRQAIILQAIIDASNSDNTNNKKVTEEPREWIFGKNKHFVKYCYEAGTDPDYIIKKTIEAIKIQIDKNRIIDVRYMDQETKKLKMGNFLKKVLDYQKSF